MTEGNAAYLNSKKQMFAYPRHCNTALEFSPQSSGSGASEPAGPSTSARVHPSHGVAPQRSPAPSPPPCPQPIAIWPATVPTATHRWVPGMSPAPPLHWPLMSGDHQHPPPIARLEPLNGVSSSQTPSVSELLKPTPQGSWVVACCGS